MVHRLALFMGGAGAAGVLALALTLNGSAPPTTTDAFVPVANELNADQLAVVLPTDPPAPVADPGGDQTAPTVNKHVDTIYVLPAPKPVVVHTTKPAGGKDSQPTETPHPPGNGGGGNGGGNVAGDDGQGDEAGDSSDDQAGGDEHDGGDRSDDGGSDDGGQEPGDD